MVDLTSAEIAISNAENAASADNIKRLRNAINLLIEELRYTLSHLETENFDEASLNAFGLKITEPLELETAGIKSTVTDLDGRFSVVEQNVDGLEITTAGGKTYISGDKIQTGTIEGVELLSRNPSDRSFVHIHDGTVELGVASMPYADFRIDDTSRAYLHTIFYPLKILAEGADMSIDSGDTIYIGTKNRQSIYLGNSVSESSDVNLYGTVYINGEELSAYIKRIAGGGV